MKKTFLLICLFFITAISYGQLTKEQESIKKIFFDFLRYYRKNEQKFHSFKLYKGGGEKGGPPYHIQWKEVDRYCAWLRKNVPFVGEAYIKNERNDFKYIDSVFKTEPDEEIPMGFDYDRWAGGQEDIGYTIEWYTSLKNKYEITLKENTAILRIGGEIWEGAEEKDRGWSEIPFIKEKGKWKMAANVHPADED